MSEPVCENCGMRHAPGDTERCIEGHGSDDIQVTIHGRYGQGPMPVEFRDAMVEMVRLVKQAVDRGEIGRPVCPKCGSRDVIEPGERYPGIWTCDPCGHDFERRFARAQPAPQDGGEG